MERILQTLMIVDLYGMAPRPIIVHLPVWEQLVDASARLTTGPARSADEGS